MRWTVTRGSSLENMPWRNGHGTSRDIVTRLGRDGGLLWKVGVADLVADAPFSHYPHCDRIFTAVAGDPPVELSIDDGPFQPCKLLVPQSFRGEQDVRCRVRAPGHAFNVITDRRHCTATLTILQLDAGDPVEVPDAPEILLYCLAGQLAAAGDLLAPGNSLLGPGAPSPAAASENSTVILVTIQPVR